MTTLAQVILEGLDANRPTAGIGGRLYFATDTEKVYYDSGSAWAAVFSGSGMVNPMTAEGDIIIGGASGAPTKLTAGTAGYVLTSGGAGTEPSWVAGSGGSVTSVGLSMPAEFTISGSPVTSNGTLTVTKANENANQVYAGPASGAASAPAFRALAAADLPVATTGTPGIVQPDGTTITIAGGVISSAPGFSNPMTTEGDLIIGGTSGAPARLAAGTAGQVLTTQGSSAEPQWSALPAATAAAEGVVQLDGDLGGTAASPQVVATHLATPLPVAQGGTGGATAAAALTSLGAAPTASPTFTGTVTSDGPLVVDNTISASLGVSQLSFNQGAESLTPTLYVANSGNEGKAAALLAGTEGSALIFDETGAFSIQADTHANFVGNALGSGATLLTLDASGNLTAAAEIKGTGFAGSEAASVAPAAGAGTGATAGFSPGYPANSSSAQVQVNTGTSPAAGNLFTLSWTVPRSGNPSGVICGSSGPSAALLPYLVSSSPTSITFAATNAPAASITYGFSVIIIG